MFEMKCPNCSFDAPLEAGLCPRCGSVRIFPNVGKSWEKRNASWLIPVTIISIVLPITVVGFLGFRAYQRLVLARKVQNEQRRLEPEHKGVAVRHGDVVKPEELQGHGKLYFVPVGKQAIPVQSLADYYLQKFSVHVTVLPQVNTRPADCVPERKQCIAEELNAEMTSTYADIASDPNSVMIALTDEDIFPREQDW